MGQTAAQNHLTPVWGTAGTLSEIACSQQLEWIRVEQNAVDRKVRPTDETAEPLGKILRLTQAALLLLFFRAFPRKGSKTSSGASSR